LLAVEGWASSSLAPPPSAERLAGLEGIVTCGFVVRGEVLVGDDDAGEIE